MLLIYATEISATSHQYNEHTECYSIVSCAPRILIGAHFLSLEITQLHGHIFFVKNRFLLFQRDHSDLRLSPESVATLPPFSPIEGQKWFDQISSQ
jgi:hypothetical protein